MVEVNSKSRIADALHHFAEVTVETFFADVLIIKRRQHQHPSATMFYCMRSELDCLGDRAATGAGHHAGRIGAGCKQSIEQKDALVCRHRVRLAGGAERGQPAVLRKQPLAMPDESLRLRRKIGLERRYDRRQYAADTFTLRQDPGFGHRQKQSRKLKPWKGESSFPSW